MATHVKAEDLAHGQWEAILRSAGLDPAFLQYREGPCPICGGNTRFRWRAEKENGICGHCDNGSGGRAKVLSGFQILQHLLGCDFRGAANWIRDWAGSPVAEQLPVRPILKRSGAHQQIDRDAMSERYRRLWLDALPLTGECAASIYLKNRVPSLVQLPERSSVRFHPALDYWQYDESARKSVKTGRYPALLGAALGPNGKGSTIWRIYLTPEGQKASVPDPKKAAGTELYPGHAVRLYEPEGGQLGIAEGLETAVAVTARWKVPTWATLTAGGMSKFVLPEGYGHIKVVRIFADNDCPDKNGRRAGNDAAHQLKARMEEQGIRAFVVLPMGTDYDFADVALTSKL